MKAYKTREFMRLARQARITDKELSIAADEIRAGRIDADLGAHLIKQRISEGYGGRSNSHRAIIAQKSGDRIVFVDLFAKSDRSNISKTELKAFRHLAKIFADLPQTEVDKLVIHGKWIEVEENPEEKGVSE